MCGITGYAGTDSSKNFLIEGLKKLEYRGYDSAGIATIENSEITVTKTKGKVEELEKKAEYADHKGNVGIGHTRWATHGKPDETNSHPHISADKSFAVVHNGIIENYQELKYMLEKEGFEFVSETDTEVIPALIQYYYKDDVFSAFSQAVSVLRGSYALGVISVYEPDKIFAVSKDSPLIIGLGEKENYISSDIPALASKTCRVYIMKDSEFAIISKNDVLITDSNKTPVKKDITIISQNEVVADKQGYEFFMLKEIMEQPEAVAGVITQRVKDGIIDFNELHLKKEYFENLNRIYIVGCGSAYHAGMAGKRILEDITRVQTQVEIASEFKYNSPIINKGDLMIAISQSGETSDTLAALKVAKSKGAEIISVVNVKDSSIARESDNVIYTDAGAEISVATTKGYTTQVIVLYILAIYIAKVKNTISDAEYRNFINQLKCLPESIEKVLENQNSVNELSKEFLTAKNVFFIGRGLDYAISTEGALKLKEISYIHSESYAAGELKHGTISLIEEGTLVIALSAVKELQKKILGNIKEVKARGATVVAIKTDDLKELDNVADYTLSVPDMGRYFSSLLAVIYLQLFAYYVSYNKGLDVDKPRNLAKSVTVE